MREQIFTTLRLQNVRSYKDFAIELAPAVNIIVGPNASGKTNLLEAMLVLCGQTSYRAGYGELIAHNKRWARIDGDTAGGSRVVKLVERDGIIERTYEINDKVKKRLSFADKLPVILFEPEHMRLLTGSPERRRNFVDEILASIQPDFNNLSQKYRRALAQRNCLLKNHHQSNKQQIFAWNVRLSELAGKIVSARVGLIMRLDNALSATYSEIAKTATKVRLQYVSPLSLPTYESALLHKLESSLNNDLAKGFTTYGPHREDITITINKQPAAAVASRGETRTMVIALKLLALDLLEQARNQKPLVLLDDVFSELDGARRHTLTKRLQGYQTIITTTDADMVQKSFMQKVNIISLS
jgi:DNA replication and repair protein RecF